MLILNQYQRLGTKTFWVLAIRNSTFGIIIFLIWAVAVGLVLNNTLNSITFLAQNAQVLKTTQDGLIIVTVVLFFLWIIAFIIALLAAGAKYYPYQFMLGDDAISIKQGFLSTKEVSIPYHHIQDVNIEQTLTDRMYGVSRIAILTAGHEDSGSDDSNDSSEGALPIIDSTLASEIRNELIHRMSIERVVSVSETSKTSASSISQTQNQSQQ